MAPDAIFEKAALEPFLAADPFGAHTLRAWHERNG
jgi:hypothetical protein